MCSAWLMRRFPARERRRRCCSPRDASRDDRTDTEDPDEGVAVGGHDTGDLRADDLEAPISRLGNPIAGNRPIASFSRSDNSSTPDLAIDPTRSKDVMRLIP
jgi:hypothetical protein